MLLVLRKNSQWNWHQLRVFITYLGQTHGSSQYQPPGSVLIGDTTWMAAYF
jgi:hypothetical protein